jgi:hypothetical protein
MLGPGETKTIKYECIAIWSFFDFSSPALEKVIRDFIMPAVPAFLRDLKIIKDTLTFIKILKGETTVEAVFLAFDVKDTILELINKHVIIPNVTYTLTLPVPYYTQRNKIFVQVYLPKEKLDVTLAYTMYHPYLSLVSDCLDAFALGIGIGTILAMEAGTSGAATPALPIIVPAIITFTHGIVPSVNTYFESLINDPSLNYTQFVSPPIIPEAFYKLPNSTESKALFYEYLYLAYLNASAESMARANGAREMNDTKYYYLQLRNAQMYAANASTYYNNLVPLLEQMVNELNKSGYINETSFIKGQEYIAKNGLPSNVTKLLTELGFTKYISISEVEECLKSAKYEPINVTAFNGALELSKKYNPAAFFNQSFAEELESISNKTLCQVILNETGLKNATVEVDGKDYPLPTSLYLNLGTKHNVTFAQVVPGLFYDYAFKELHVGNETFTNPSYQLTVLEPSSITAVYESRLSMLSIALASVAVSALVAVAYLIKRKHSSKVR